MGVTPRAACIAIVVLFAAASTDSCSFADPPVFAFERRPDAPVATYVAGRLGVLLPTFAHSHLVIAYRYLSGKPLSKSEQAGARAVIDKRLNEEWWNGERAIDQWLEARNAVAGTIKPRFGAYRGFVSEYFLNCTDDAFHTAVATLNARVKQFGTNSAAVHNWIEAQDVVFDNCGEGKAVPAAAPADLPPIIRKDRDYQIAAATLYATDFEHAHDLFQRIATDRESPWADISSYIAARSLAREATAGFQSGGGEAYGYSFDRASLERAERETRAVLAKYPHAPFHAAAVRLLAFIRFRLQPKEYLADVVAHLTTGNSPSTFATDLGDYTSMLDIDVRNDDDLTDWIDTFTTERDQENDDLAQARTHALDRWRERHDTRWLVAALSLAGSDSPAADELLEASRNITPQSPAYVTCAMDRLRLLRARGRESEWRAQLEELAAQPESVVPPSARNSIRALQLPLAASVDDLAATMPRNVVGTWSQHAAEKPEVLFDVDATSTLNETTPIDILVRMASDARLDANLRRALLIAAWTRAFIAKRDDVTVALAPRLAEADKDLRNDLKRFTNDRGEERWFDGIDLLARFPGLTPYVGPLDSRLAYNADLRDVPHDRYTHENWWCRKGWGYWQDRPDAEHPPVGITPPVLQSADVRAAVAREQQSLAKAGCGATFVLRNAVRWSRERPHDPRVARALATAIATTQWACPDPDTHRAAKAAYERLKSAYGSTKWAKETRYWYDGKD